jgi:hypothetical protein
LVEFQNSTRLVFNGWNDGNNQTQRSVVLDGNVELVGSYRTQNLLRVNSPVSSYSEWYDAGSNAELHSPSSVPMNWPFDLLGLQYNFVGWTGDVNSRIADVNVTMNSPKTLNANFSADYSPLILPVVIACGVTGAVAFLMFRRPRQSNGNKSETLRCGKCGEVVENDDWTHCIRCGASLRDSESLAANRLEPK